MEVQRAEEHLDSEARLLHSTLGSLGLLNAPDIPVWAAPAVGAARVTLQQAADLAGPVYFAASSHCPTGESLSDHISARHKRVLTAIGYLATCRTQLFTSVQAAAAGAVVSLHALPSKLNPVIRSLMASIKGEESSLLLQRAATSLAMLLDQCLQRDVSPNAKVLSNLAGLLTAGTLDNDDVTSAPIDDDTRKLNAQMRAGSAVAVRALARHFGARLFDSLPSLWAAIADPLTAPTASIKDAITAKPLMESLALTRELAIALHVDLHSRVFSLGNAICELVQHTFTPLQAAAGSCIAALCRSMPPAAMELVIRIVLPLLSDPERPHARLGAAGALQQVHIVLIHIRLTVFDIHTHTSVTLPRTFL